MARACTAQGRFMRQKWSQFSSFGVVSTMQMLRHQRHEESDLEDGEPAAQRLDGRVAPRVDGVGEERQQDSVVHGVFQKKHRRDRQLIPRQYSSCASQRLPDL